MQYPDPDSITLDKLSLPLLHAKKVEVDVLRLDKIHPIISGNKWFKLRYYLDDARKQRKKTIVTFGGAWSNHLLATAAACQLNNLESIGIIRGEEAPVLSETLIQAKRLGMQLVFTSRELYRKKRVPVEMDTTEYYLINEGGFGKKGVEGAATIAAHFEKDNYTHICCAVGTGTMLAGLSQNILLPAQVIGISVLKNNFELEKNIESLLPGIKNNFQLIHDYHFGGYAKYKPVLIDFMNDFYRQTGIPTDFVYTGKLFYALTDLIGKGFFDPFVKLLIIHSGGLQGNASLSKGTLIF